jgi:hypothetical protein
MCKKDKEDLKKIKSKDALFKCKTCGETAHKEKHLCKPKKN